MAGLIWSGTISFGVDQRFFAQDFTLSGQHRAGCWTAGAPTTGALGRRRTALPAGVLGYRGSRSGGVSGPHMGRRCGPPRPRPRYWARVIPVGERRDRRLSDGLRSVGRAGSDVRSGYSMLTGRAPGPPPGTRRGGRSWVGDPRSCEGFDQWCGFSTTTARNTWIFDRRHRDGGEVLRADGAEPPSRRVARSTRRRSMRICHVCRAGDARSVLRCD